MPEMIGMVAKAPAERETSERKPRRSKAVKGTSGPPFYTLISKKEKGGKPPFSQRGIESGVRS
jgi:hypothetical protein